MAIPENKIPRGPAPKPYKVRSAERDTYTRLLALFKARKIAGFVVAGKDQWEVYDTDEDMVKARTQRPRKVLTEAQVRERFKFVLPPKAKKEKSLRG